MCGVLMLCLPRQTRQTKANKDGTFINSKVRFCCGKKAHIRCKNRVCKLCMYTVPVIMSRMPGLYTRIAKGNNTWGANESVPTNIGKRKYYIHDRPASLKTSPKLYLHINRLLTSYINTATYGQLHLHDLLL